MTLSWQVMAAVLFGALLHASWNALVKSSSDKALDIALIHLLCSFISLPLVALVGWPPAHVWPYILASTVIHIGYYIALSGAYENGELGLTYPLMRGTAPLLVALSAAITLGEHLTLVAWVGVVGICGGVMLIGLSKNALKSKKAIQFALLNAVFIALYTVVDALGVRASGNAAQYVLAIFVFDGWPFAMLVFYRKRAHAWQYVSKRWGVGTIGAFASMGSYGIALWAMTRAPVASVAALRETSVLFAALIGAWFLKEQLTVQRTIGIVAIVAGAILLRLS